MRALVWLLALVPAVLFLALAFSALSVPIDLIFRDDWKYVVDAYRDDAGLLDKVLIADGFHNLIGYGLASYYDELCCRMAGGIPARAGIAMMVVSAGLAAIVLWRDPVADRVQRIAAIAVLLAAWLWAPWMPFLIWNLGIAAMGSLAGTLVAVVMLTVALARAPLPGAPTGEKGRAWPLALSLAGLTVSLVSSGAGPATAAAMLGLCILHPARGWALRRVAPLVVLLVLATTLPALWLLGSDSSGLSPPAGVYQAAANTASLIGLPLANLVLDTRVTPETYALVALGSGLAMLALAAAALAVGVVRGASGRGRSFWAGAGLVGFSVAAAILIATARSTLASGVLYPRFLGLMMPAFIGVCWMSLYSLPAGARKAGSLALAALACIVAIAQFQAWPAHRFAGYAAERFGLAVIAGSRSSQVEQSVAGRTLANYDRVRDHLKSEHLSMFAWPGAARVGRPVRSVRGYERAPDCPTIAVQRSMPFDPGDAPGRDLYLYGIDVGAPGESASHLLVVSGRRIVGYGRRSSQTLAPVLAEHGISDYLPATLNDFVGGIAMPRRFRQGVWHAYATRLEEGASADILVMRGREVLCRSPLPGAVLGG